MPRKRGSNGTTNNANVNGGGGEGKRDEWKWANLRLSPEDIDILGSSDATLEYLATQCCELADGGIGFTVKPADLGKSRCAILYRPDFPVSGRTLAVSAYADNARDALLTVLYKLDTYGGGDFTGFDVADIPQGIKSRFR